MFINDSFCVLFITIKKKKYYFKNFHNNILKTFLVFYKYNIYKYLLRSKIKYILSEKDNDGCKLVLQFS